MPGPLWLALTIPVFLAALALLIRAASKTIRAAWAEPFAAVQLAPPPAGSDSIEASIELTAPGAVAISAEGKRFSRDFGGLSVALAEAHTGRAVPVHKKLMPVTTSGVSRVRIKLWSAEIPAAGRYTVSVHRLHPERSYAESQLLFLPDVALIGLILQLVALGIVCIGALVATGLLAFGSRVTGPG